MLSREQQRWSQQTAASAGGREQTWRCHLAAAPIIIGSTWGELNSNSVLIAGFWGWFVAQSLKIFTKRYKFGVWDIKAVFDSGGMPSSHSALCMAVTTALGLEYGLQSPLFAVALCFSLIVMYDAAGVRRHAGKQAEVLNVVLSDLLHGHPASANKLKEVLGHTPLQVICGACLGIIVGALFPGPAIVAAV